MGLAGLFADLADRLGLGQLAQAAQRHVFGAVVSSGMPIDTGIEGLRREPAQKGADLDCHAQPHEAAGIAVTQGVQLLLDMGLSQHGFRL